jgi:hypothetical protein
MGEEEKSFMRLTAEPNLFSLALMLALKKKFFEKKEFLC